MNKYYVIGALMMIFIAGCVQTTTPGETTPTTQPTAPPAGGCRMVPTEEPYTEVECVDVAYTEEECTMKELQYTVGPIEKTDLCVSGSCTGKNISECFYSCTNAMKRCRMSITNEDEKHSGVWVVGATFSYMEAAFVKNPESAEIEPKEKYTFDFTQMYSMGQYPTIATCSLTVLYPAIVRDCVQVERMRTDCINISKVRIVQRQVCD